jgi:L-ascorbate metabolism protein UlaG (beta-lactamase superfamily)
MRISKPSTRVCSWNRERSGSCSIRASSRLWKDGVTITAFDAPNASILGADRPQKTAYVINDIFLYPGDSFAERLLVKKKTPVLALPVMASWTTELAVAEFARRMSPQQIISIHDGYAKDFFLQQRYENFSKHFETQGIRFHWMQKAGNVVEIEN